MCRKNYQHLHKAQENCSQWEKKCKRSEAYKRSLQTQTSHTKSGLHKQTAFIISAYLIKCRKICHPLHKAQNFSRSTNFCSLHSGAGKIISICISRREIVCSEKKCKRSGVYFAHAGTEPMQSPLHKKHKSGLYKPLCFSAYSIRRRIFREVRVPAPCTQAQDFFRNARHMAIWGTEHTWRMWVPKIAV